MLFVVCCFLTSFCVKILSQSSQCIISKYWALSSVTSIIYQLLSNVQYSQYPISKYLVSALLIHAKKIDYGQYKYSEEEGRNTQYVKVSIVRNPSKYLVHQSISSTKLIEILSILKYQQYVNHRNTQYTKVSIVRNPSKSLVHQSISLSLIHI